MSTFVRVVEAGSLSGAARTLGVSVASVSRQLAALEADLGVALVLRSTRALALTAAGSAYFAECVHLLAEIDAAMERARDGASRANLVVSAPVTFGLACVLPHLLPFSIGKDATRIDLRLEDRRVDLVEEGVDLGIRTGLGPPDSAEWVAHELASYRRVLVAGPDYLRAHGTPPDVASLACHAALVHLPADGCASSWELHTPHGCERVVTRAVLRTNAVCALREAALASAGIALLPEWLVEDDVATGRLVRVLRGAASAAVPVLALHRATLRREARVRAVLATLRRAFVGGVRAGASAFTPSEPVLRGVLP